GGATGRARRGGGEPAAGRPRASGRAAAGERPGQARRSRGTPGNGPAATVTSGTPQRNPGAFAVSPPRPQCSYVRKAGAHGARKAEVVRARKPGEVARWSRGGLACR